MNDLTILIGVLGILAAELVLSATWNRFYFSKGICVFKRQYKTTMREAELPRRDVVVGKRDALFSVDPSVVIHRLQEQEYAVCAEWFIRPFLSFNYGQVIRGNIKIEESGGILTLRYFLNWTLVAVTLCLLGLSLFSNGLHRPGGFLLGTIFAVALVLFPLLIARAHHALYIRALHQTFQIEIEKE